ncbi:MAG: BCD family MFS transporter [Pseudorhodoplanes sp.]|uniref:BCD family MFS transporter n=1 Tax=Pseudorhodoplanes sp. TaxID=1934341 RepID=UPI003D0CB6C4
MKPLGWFGIVRLGLVQTALGAIVVLTTSTLNRVMVVEMALPAMVPGILVALHYALQIFRPRFGFGSDTGGRRTPWIVGGMAMLCAGGTIAAAATALMATHPFAGIGLAVLGFLCIGFGVGASGTTLLVLLATRTDERRRPAAATIVWVMMIAGFIVTAATAGSLLDPFSPARLVAVASGVSLVAFVLSLVAVWDIEGDTPKQTAASSQQKATFRQALAEVWAEPQARRFGIFVFISMLAFSAQDLILEPFAGIVFGYTPGESTRLSGVQNSGVLAGMVLVAVAGSAIGGKRLGSLPLWTVIGCVCSALALFGLVLAAAIGPSWPLRVSVFGLGFFNGVYAVAAIGSMMALVGKGAPSREGVRMGLWGAAQAFAFGLGGFLGAAASDLARHWLGSPAAAYGTVFAIEGLLFLLAAVLALRLNRNPAQDRATIKTISGRNVHASA